MGDLNKNHKLIRKNQVKRCIHKIFGTVLQAFFLKNQTPLLFFLFSIFFLSSLPFFALILSYICHVFFSSMSCTYTIGQLFVPLGSSFLDAMMNGDFQGFFLCSNQLSIIKYDCTKQVTVDLSRSFSKCPQIISQVLEFFLKSLASILVLLAWQ